MQYTNETQETEKKQQLLKKEIYDRGYDCQAFQDYMDQLKANGGQDISIWTFNEIRQAISVFQTMNHPIMETIELEDSFVQNQSNSNRQSEIDTQKQHQEQLEQKQAISHPSSQQQINTQQITNEVIAKPLIDNERFYQKTYPCKIQEKKIALTSKDVNIIIQKYEKIGGGLFSSAYYQYYVITEPLDWNVQRRYSDFLWLREIFCKIYPGRNIPPLPKKSVLKNEESLYLQKRMNFLQRFLQAILKCDLLKHDKWFYAFLSIKEDKDFKHIQKLSQQLSRVNKLEQITSLDGQIQLLINDNLTNYNKESNFIINQFDLGYKKLRKESKQLLLDFDQITNTIFSMGDTCANLYQASKNFNSNIPQGKISELDILYISLNNMLVSWGNNLTQQINFVQEQLCHFFKFHHHSILTLKEFIKQKEQTQQEYEKFKQKLELKKNKLFQSQDYQRWEVPTIQIKALQDSNLIQNKDVCLAIMLPQETTLQEDLKNIYAYYNNQSFIEINKLLENTVEEFSEHFIKFCSNQKELQAEQKLSWDKSIINLNNLNNPQELLNKKT